MKHRKVILMTILLLLSLTACRGGSETAATEGSVEPPAATQPETAPATEPEPTALMVGEDYEVFRQPEEVTVYPFTEEEISQAMGVAKDAGEALQYMDGTLAFTVERLAYDPILTDIHIRQQIAGAPVPGWTEGDYYSHYISFTMVYSAAYDHEKAFVQDADSHEIGLHLYREDAQSPWKFSCDGIAITPVTHTVVDGAELSRLGPGNCHVVAAYKRENGEYWLYVWEETGKEVQFMHWTDPNYTEPLPAEQAETGGAAIKAVWDESTYQVGAPVTPQPGDTQATWDLALAAEHPADGDCTSGELLEKWMAVEGLTLADLDARDCRQLVLTAAQETDGVGTITTCYEKQADGTWAAVEGLSRMHGWTGGNGIAHDRKRNTDTSPAGLWELGLAFGNSPKPDGLKMPWRDITPNTDWVCDAGSIYYNTWQERNAPGLLETWSNDVEHLEDYPNAYAYACVIRYNTPPYMVPERGCAIFFHCSKGPTAGCIGLPEQDMVNTLLWLDPAQNPHILITGYQKG